MRLAICALRLAWANHHCKPQRFDCPDAGRIADYLSRLRLVIGLVKGLG
jgi:hypothetical protein